MPPKGRRGGPGGPGGPSNSGNSGSQGAQRNRICKPATKLPTSLQLHPTNEPIPGQLTEALPEFRKAQPFFSALERIAPEVTTPSRMHACWLGVSGAAIESLERSADNELAATLHLTDHQTHPVFLKRIHILDPLDCIEGECVWPTEGALPAPAELWMTALEKINDPMNEAYVDAVFALLADRLTTSNLSPHWLRCFGTFTARVNRYAYNITEEYPSLKRKSFWSRHQRLGLFRLRKDVEEDTGSRRDREPLAVNFSEDQEMDVGDFEIPELPTSSSSPPVAAEVDDAGIEAEEVNSVQLNAPLVRIRRLEDVSELSSSSSSSSSSDASSDEDDGNEYFAEFTDYPVQVTLLERAEGTMDELLDAEARDEAKWTAWIFQVVAALSVAQHYFGFVHNDLHTNNVMWCRTEREYLYYRVHSKGGKKVVYRVPTHGYIMKIIDFGRASYHLPSGFFISDAFFPGHDAGQQYNCEPFFDPRAGKKVEPNPSFDLCRLAISLLEAIFPTRPAAASPLKIMSREGPKSYAETVSPLYNLLWGWLTDDAGKNMLREPNGEERYPDFDLYTAIAADVHSAIPGQQLEKSVFAAFQYVCADAALPTEPIYDLWVG